MITLLRRAAPLASLLLLGAATTAYSQAHQTRSGPCSVRSSTADSRSIDAAIAAAHQFSTSADVAIINVTVRCRGASGNGTVPAQIAVTRRDLAGTPEDVNMHLDRQNGYVSYYGTFPRIAGALVTLTVTATPQGKSGPMTLTYRHRFAAR